MKKKTGLLTAFMILSLFLLGVCDLHVEASSTWRAPVWEDYKIASVRWNIPNGAYDECDVIDIVLYRDGNRVSQTGFYKESNKNSDHLYALFNEKFDESGSYTVKVVGYKRNEDGNLIEAGIESLESNVFEYTLPQMQLPVPKGLKWIDGTELYSQYDWAKDKSFYATAFCDEVEGASSYEFQFYSGETKVYWCRNLNFCNFTDHIVDPAFDYTFSVRAISSDILTYRNSEWSERSVKYTYSNYDDLSESPAEIPGLDCAWNVVGGKSYWYENGVKQGTYDDPNGVMGDGTVRGREIYDAASNG